MYQNGVVKILRSTNNISKSFRIKLGNPGKPPKPGKLSRNASVLLGAAK